MTYTYYHSTSSSGGNLVDGLPPALSSLAYFRRSLMLWGGFLSAWHLDKCKTVWASFFDLYVVKNQDFPEIRKTLQGPQKPSETHTLTSGKTPDLRERSSHMTRRAVVCRVPPRGGISESSGPMQSLTWPPEIKFLKNYSLL